MPDPSPSPESGALAVGSAPALRVDPAALAQVAALLQERADAMRSAAPPLQSAWVQAASVLAAEHTGAVLDQTRIGAAVALDEFATSVESLAQTLRRGAQDYARAESVSIGAR